MTDKQNTPAGEATMSDEEYQAFLVEVSGKWVIPILEALGREPLRHSALARHIPNVSQKVLTQHLRMLERNGMVVRTVIDTVPPTVTYAITELGISLNTVSKVFRGWSEENRSRIAGAQRDFDSRP